MFDDLQPVVKDGCGVFGVLRKDGAERIGNSVALTGIECAKYRGSSLGAGFAAFGASRDSQPPYRVKTFVDGKTTLQEVRTLLADSAEVEKVDERIPSFDGDGRPFGVYTAFINAPDEVLAKRVNVVNSEMRSNGRIRGRVYSYGRYVNVYKGVGHPTDVAKACDLVEDRVFADAWIAHTRQPTNSPGFCPFWSHPFAAFEFALVHNGDISSFGSNMEFLNSVGVRSHVGTDSEVIVRLLDHLVRVCGLSIEEAATILSNPFEEDHGFMNRNCAAERRLVTKMRGAQLDGPFTAVVGYCDGKDTYLLGLVDKSKFRPAVVGEDASRFMIASEETQIRALSPDAEVWTIEPRSFFLCSIKKGVIRSGKRGKVEA